MTIDDPIRQTSTPTLGTRELADALGVHQGHARRICAEGAVSDARRRGHRWEIPVRTIVAIRRSKDR